MRRALLCIDVINEIVDPRGKLAGKGYAAFCRDAGTLDRVARLQHWCRAQALPVIHVRVGFSPGYPEQPKHSPLFGKADQFGALQLGSWGTEFHPQALPAAGELVLVKHRVSAFYATSLELCLRTAGVDELIIAGVATDLAVDAAVRDAHDRDFAVILPGDCCAAASSADHQRSLTTLAKLAQVVTLAELEAR